MYVILPYWDDIGRSRLLNQGFQLLELHSWWISSSKAKTCQTYIVNNGTMAADAQTTQLPRKSAAMALTLVSQNIPASAQKGQ